MRSTEGFSNNFSYIAPPTPMADTEFDLHSKNQTQEGNFFITEEETEKIQEEREIEPTRPLSNDSRAPAKYLPPLQEIDFKVNRPQQKKSKAHHTD